MGKTLNETYQSINLVSLSFMTNPPFALINATSTGIGLLIPPFLSKDPSKVIEKGFVISVKKNQKNYFE